ncbi:MAG TPA: GAF domain-containing sensor histidine kinase [Flavobacteriaceae bacterium]|nr:GAF domain-containing sensor histidine kinase [Flavobacteriaceae bacterium]
MIEPKKPANESERLLALQKLNLLGSVSEREYDEITKLAAYICKAPISLISIIGEKDNWFKSKFGTEMSGSPRKYSHCGHAILDPGSIMEVPDARQDERFKDNPYTLAPEPVIFYTGIPLLNKSGHALGTLCVIDHVPRQLDDQQKTALKYLAHQVTNLFEQRSRNFRLKKIQKELKERNEQLKNFAAVVSHDMKMPLANIIVTIDLLKAKYGNDLNEQMMEYLEHLKSSAFSLSDYVSGILTHYESDNLSNEGIPEQFDLNDLLEEIVDMVHITDDCVINFPKKNKELHCNKIALEQILLNLINNSAKYNDKKTIVIDIKCKDDGGFYNFKVRDNGIGIPKDKQTEIFQLFSTVAHADRNGKKGNGIGLSTVKKLVENLGGNIKVSSNEGEGTTFKFSIKKPALTKKEFLKVS